MREGPFPKVHLAARLLCVFLLGIVGVTFGIGCSLVVDTRGLSGGAALDSMESDSGAIMETGSLEARDALGGGGPDGMGDETSILGDADAGIASPDSGGATDSATASENAADSAQMDATAVDSGTVDSAPAVDSGTVDSGAPAADASDAAPSLCAAGNARVFVTSAQQSNGGDLGGTPGADATCNAAATAAGLGGTWNAWLSDSHAAATSRVYHASGAYTLVDGATVVALSYAALVSGTLAHAIDVTENGATVSDGQTEVWTGFALAGGVSGFCAQSGKDWASMAASNSGTPMVGHLDATDNTWTYAYFQTCDRTNVRLYCFERCP
jgi:hypothetical protein